MERDSTVVENGVAGAGVAISRLANRAHIDHDLLRPQHKLVIQFVWTIELEILREHTRNMGMALEGAAVDEGEDLLHLATVVDVFREDVLVERVAGGSVHEDAVAILVASGTLPQELPTARPVIGARRVVFELGTGPENCSFGTRIEAFGVEKGALVVISQKANVRLHHFVDALARVWTVANDIPQTVNLGCPLSADIIQNRAQGLNIAVNVANQRSFQGLGLASRNVRLLPKPQDSLLFRKTRVKSRSPLCLRPGGAKL